MFSAVSYSLWPQEKGSLSPLRLDPYLEFFANMTSWCSYLLSAVLVLFPDPGVHLSFLCSDLLALTAWDLSEFSLRL